MSKSSSLPFRLFSLQLVLRSNLNPISQSAMPATPSNAYPPTNGANQLPCIAKMAAERRRPPAPPVPPLRTDDLPSIPAAASGISSERQWDSPIDPTALSPSRTEENSPTRYEPYMTTLFGRKPRMTAKVQAAGGWKALHASVRTRMSTNKARRPRRRRVKGQISGICSPPVPHHQIRCTNAIRQGVQA